MNNLKVQYPEETKEQRLLKLLEDQVGTIIYKKILDKFDVGLLEGHTDVFYIETSYEEESSNNIIILFDRWEYSEGSLSLIRDEVHSGMIFI